MGIGFKYECTECEHKNEYYYGGGFLPEPKWKQSGLTEEIIMR